MSAANVDDKSLKYIRQGTGTADAKDTGAALKRQAEALAKIGDEKNIGVDKGKPSSSDSPFIQVDRVLKRCQYSQDSLIEVLHAAQETFDFLSDDTMTY